MKERFEYKGYWWLPSNPDKTIAGILTYIPNESIKLELIGSFDTGDDPLMSYLEHKSEDIIYGVTSDAKEITLFNCNGYGSLNLSVSFPIMKFSCRYLVIGKHLEEYNQKCFFKANIDIPVLNHWAPPTSIQTTIMFNSKERIESTSVSFGTNKKVQSEVAINENTTLIVRDGITYQGDHYAPTINQYTYLQILKDGDHSLQEFISDIYMFEQFLSLATLQGVQCSKITLFDESVYQELKDGEKHYHTIELIYIQNETIQPLKKESYNYLFEYKTIKEQYPSVITKWYSERTDIAPIRKHLIDSVKYKKPFSSIDFLIIIQALEGFGIRFRVSTLPKKPSLSRVIEELTSEFSTINILKGETINIKQAVDSRHYYSHFMDKASKPNTLDGVELYHLTLSLRKLLICCVLHFIGFNYDEINVILNKSNSHLLHRAK